MKSIKFSRILDANRSPNPAQKPDLVLIIKKKSRKETTCLLVDFAVPK